MSKRNYSQMNKTEFLFALWVLIILIKNGKNPNKINLINDANPDYNAEFALV